MSRVLNPSRNSFSILVVEDDPDQLAGYVRALELAHYGYVQGAASGVQAVAAEQQRLAGTGNGFDLIVFDFDLSRANQPQYRQGMQVYLTLRALSGAQLPRPVVWVSGEVDVHQIEEAAAFAQLGDGETFFFFHKPVNVERLLIVIDRLLEIRADLAGGVVIAQPYWR